MKGKNLLIFTDNDNLIITVTVLPIITIPFKMTDINSTQCLIYITGL